MVSEAEKITNVLRYAPGACLLVESGTIRGANGEAVGLSGIPRQHLVGVALDELVIDDDKDDVRSCLANKTEGVRRLATRLTAGLQPVEIAVRRVDDRIAMVGLRSMAYEHEMSALAGAPLTHDQVTGLPNRQHMLERLHDRLSQTPSQPLALIGIWIDDLAQLKEERGSRVVDRVNRQVAERIQARLRGPDVLGCFDESAFLTLLTSDSDLEQLRIIADRLRSEVAFPVDFDGGLVSFTASVMVASIGPKRPSIERVLSRLEAVGQKAAASGGNRTDIFTL